MESLASQPAVRRRDDTADERLIDLFWNRAELKKAFARLRAERDLLQDRLRQQEGQMLRLQQRISQLEGLLSEPGQAANAALYYQLRSLWALGRRRLEQLARDLTERAQQAELRCAMSRFEARREASLQEIDAQIATVESRVLECDQRLHALSGLSLRRFWHALTTRQHHQIEISALQATRTAATEQLGILRDRRDKLCAESVPAPTDLPLARKRQINLAVIGLAQELFLHFCADGLADLARQASLRQLTDLDFGGRSNCRRLSRAAAELSQSLDSRTDLKDRVRRRAAGLARAAVYRLETDAVPESGCCMLIARDLDEAGRIVGTGVEATNVLSDDYWDLCAVLVN
jgi:hypothetical protein